MRGSLMDCPCYSICVLGNRCGAGLRDAANLHGAVRFGVSAKDARDCVEALPAFIAETGDGEGKQKPLEAAAAGTTNLRRVAKRTVFRAELAELSSEHARPLSPRY